MRRDPMPDAKPRQTTDQRRASHAWECVRAVVGSSDAKARKEFGTQAKKLPTRIMTAGLGQALAFLEAQQYAPELRGTLASWLHERRPAKNQDEAERLVLRVIRGDAEFLRYATAEALAYLQWLVRFADAEKLTDAETGG
jgi:CRISPR-associated protein Cmr5